MQTVAVGWTVYGIHHRPFDLGLVGLVTFAPSLLLVFVAGHVVDRYDRKRIVVVAAIAEAGCSLVLAGLALAHVRDLVAMLAGRSHDAGVGRCLLACQRPRHGA